MYQHYFSLFSMIKRKLGSSEFGPDDSAARRFDSLQTLIRFSNDDSSVHDFTI